MDIALWFSLVRFDLRCSWGRGRTDRALVFEDDVVAPKRPAMVTGVEMVAKGQDAPYQRVVNAGEWRCELVKE